MIRIFEVRTENKDGRKYSAYKVAAKTCAEAMRKVQKKEIDPFDVGERISEVIMLASEGK